MSSCNEFNIKDVISHFKLYGDFIDAAAYGNGHINDTFLIDYIQAGCRQRYILQRINNIVFREPERLMENIDRICTELHRRLKEEGTADASRRALTIVPSESDLPYYKDENGSYWRVYLFIEDAAGYDIVENEEQAYQAARAFGEFQKLLTELPGKRLYETIPDFHNTPKRFRRFRQVIEEDSKGRAAEAADEISFYLSFENEVGHLLELNAKGLIPERVTHNDTKLNNVLIDTDSHRALCVIDLDTSMPGLAPYDFGDLVRTSTTASAEDEKELSKVVFLPEMFKALTRGYLSTAADFLTEAELENLYFGGRLLTFETGMRFLTDFLEGDVYYKTAFPEHNLIRSRTQAELIKQLDCHRVELESFILEEYQKAGRGS